MNRLPVIVSLGGISAAGRTSGHHGYRRMVMESLPDNDRRQTLTGLATMMGLLEHREGRLLGADGEPVGEGQVPARLADAVCDSTLVRRIEPGRFDVEALAWSKRQVMTPINGHAISFLSSRRELPDPLPSSWSCEEIDDKTVRVSVGGPTEIKVESRRAFPVKVAGQLPSGFDPARLYRSRFQPRGVQMAVYGASDAVLSMGIDWSVIRDNVAPDQIGVYSGSAMGQLDGCGTGGMLQARLQGGRVSSKNLAMGLNTMPTDFINAYVIGSVGVTNTSTGACASFLYNLRVAIDDIRAGRVRVAMVGSSEAPITPEILDGYYSMGALATDEGLRRLYGDEIDYRRACRPFSENCGFTLGESAQHFILMDDELAMELGATIHGSVVDVFINADGFKRSITAPGPGNFFTLAKAVAAACAVLDEERVINGSFVMAHGSSTPQNRVTESQIFDRIARTFGISAWPVAAVKAFVGHSLSAASGDQLAASLGAFVHGWLPGIKTIDGVADDVAVDRLRIESRDLALDESQRQVAFLNSKGFGGNNATACVLAPHVTRQMLQRRYGDRAWAAYSSRAELTAGNTWEYDQAQIRGDLRAIYRFGDGMIDDSEIELSSREIRVPGFAQPVSLEVSNPYADMC